jgi:hypothetical protein
LTAQHGYCVNLLRLKTQRQLIKIKYQLLFTVALTIAHASYYQRFVVNYSISNGLLLPYVASKVGAL